MMDKLNIYQRINEVRKGIKYVHKDKDVGGQYKAVTHDAVTAEIRPLLVKHGLIRLISLMSDTVKRTGITTRCGVPIIRYEALYRIRWINIDDPEQEFVQIHVRAHVFDEHDKAPGKAMSYAAKYAALKILDLETDEDEEARLSQHDKDQPVGEYQAKTIWHLLERAVEEG